MTNYVFWLLSYIRLALTLTLDNHQTTIESSRMGENHAILTSANFKSLNPTSGTLHNLFMYEKYKKSDDILLLDNVLSALIDNFYRKKQLNHIERSFEWSANQGAANSHSLKFLYDKNNNKLKEKEKKKRKLQVASNELKTKLRIGKPYSSVAMYIEAFTPIHTLVRPRLNRMSLNENIDKSKVRDYRINPSMSYDSETTLVTTKGKLFGKRNRIPSNIRKDIKESKQKKLSTTTAIATADSSIISQFILRSARGNRQYDVPQIGELLNLII
jgi:hypothetical protein